MSNKLLYAQSDRVFPIKSNSVDLIVTSPPYWQLKDYHTSQQIGYYDNYLDYHIRLNKTWSECLRVLKTSGFCCVVASDLKQRDGIYNIVPINAHIVTLMCRLGFIFEGTMIWRKTARNGSRIDPNLPYPKMRFNYECIHIFRKGKARKKPTFRNAKYAKYLSEGIIWTANPKQKDHPAAFPLEIPDRLIQAFSKPFDVVLDPFIGTGTTMIAASNRRRSCIGMDNNMSYLTKLSELMKVRIHHHFYQRPVKISKRIVFNDYYNLKQLRGGKII